MCDCTFFRKRKDKDGLIIFYDLNSQRVVYASFISSETIQVYRTGIEYLLNHGYIIESVTIDGRTGISRLFESYGIPVQICQFHVQKRIRTRTTRNPRSECGRDLSNIATRFIRERWTRQEFEVAVLDILETYEDFLKEKGDTGQYKHRNLRSALYGIRSALPNLFTCIDPKYTHLAIPNTTNHIDGGINTKVKDLVRRHRGMKIERRNKLILHLLIHIGEKKKK